MTATSASTMGRDRAPTRVARWHVARAIWAYVKVHLSVMLVLRASFFVGGLNRVVAPAIALLVWLAVSEASAQEGHPLPYGRDELVTYYVLLAAVATCTETRHGDGLASTIRSGELAVWLVRPAPFMAWHIGNNIGEKVPKLVALGPSVVLVGLVFGTDLRLGVGHLSPAVWATFALTLFLGATVAFLLDSVVGSVAFWTEDVSGLLRLKQLAAGLLGGQFVPLALFPEGLLPALEAQPFRYTMSFPLEVLTRDLGWEAIIRGLAWQAAYCIVLLLCYRGLWRHGLPRFSQSAG